MSTKKTFNTALNEVCSTDSTRPMYQCVHFENGFCYATNGQAAIKQSLEIHSVIDPDYLDGRSLHKDNFKAVRTFEFARAIDEGIECWNTNGQKAYFEYYRPEGEAAIEDPERYKMPDIDKIINTHKRVEAIPFIGFDVEQLAKLKKALYDPENNLRCQFTGVGEKILIDAIGVDDQAAIIMPLILNAVLF